MFHENPIIAFRLHLSIKASRLRSDELDLGLRIIATILGEGA